MNKGKTLPKPQFDKDQFESWKKTSAHKGFKQQLQVSKDILKTAYCHLEDKRILVSFYESIFIVTRQTYRGFLKSIID